MLFVFTFYYILLHTFNVHTPVSTHTTPNGNALFSHWNCFTYTTGNFCASPSLTFVPFPDNSLRKILYLRPCFATIFLSSNRTRLQTSPLISTLIIFSIFINILKIFTNKRGKSVKITLKTCWKIYKGMHISYKTLVVSR